MTQRRLLRRINKQLARDGKGYRIYRCSWGSQDLTARSTYFSYDQRHEIILENTVDIVRLSQELGLLRPGELLTKY